MQQTPPDSSYAWSTVRIAEQVTINVITWAVLAILAATVAGLGLFAQWLAHYIVVPTHVLVAVVCIGVGVVLTLGILSGGAYLYARTHPETLLALFAGLLVAALYLSWRDGSLAKAMKQAAAEMAKAQAPPDAQRDQGK